MNDLPRIVPLGEQALTIGLGAAIDEETHRRVRALAATVERQSIDGLLEICPAYTTVTLQFDPNRTSAEILEAAVREILAAPLLDAADDPERPIHEIPVRYDGIDLDAVSQRLGLSQREVIALHSGCEYRVYCLGFVPGFSYLGPLDPALVIPRRPAPRPRVPPGSVAIAGAQTGIYPFGTPGGWHLLGTTSSILFDPARARPTLLAVGDRVRFVESA